MSNFVDYSGQKFGRLTVLSRAENKNGRTMFNCVCECGNKKAISFRKYFKRQPSRI